MHRTLIFCNTVDSCRATEYAVREHCVHTNQALSEESEVVCYHGDMNSKEREVNLQLFREGICFFLHCYYDAI